MKPSDIYDMRLWEFNAYLRGYQEVYHNEQINLMKQSYYTGMFSNNDIKKIKSLDYYINKIDQAFNKTSTKEVNVKKSREIHKTIEMLKRGGSVYEPRNQI